MASKIFTITVLLATANICLSFNAISSNRIAHGVCPTSSSVLKLHKFRDIEQSNRRSNMFSATSDAKLAGENTWDQSTLDSSTQTSMTKVAMEDTEEETKDKWIARTILIVVSAFYGTNFGCVKILGEALDPSVAAALRFTLAALVFLPYLLKVIKTKPQLVRGGLEVGAYNALGYWTQASALVTTSASTVAFICSLAVIVVPILDALFPKKTASKDVAWYAPLLPALVAVAGVGCLELGGDKIPGFGDFFALGQPLFFGLGFWRIEGFMRESKEPGDAQAFTGAMMISVALFAFMWSLHDFILPSIAEPAGLMHAFQMQMTAFNDWKVIAAIAWTGIVTTALTAYGENYSMKSLSASESTIIYSTEPLWGTAFAAVALGETVGINTAVGAALIMCACVWSTLGPAISGTYCLPI
jgi:drug/metabolite transporter (DMT)-like permease